MNVWERMSKRTAECGVISHFALAMQLHRTVVPAVLDTASIRSNISEPNGWKARYLRHQIPRHKMSFVSSRRRYAQLIRRRGTV